MPQAALNLAQIQTRLESLGLSWPQAAKPAAAYLPALVHDKMVMISGQLPIGADGTLIRGIVGKDLNLEQGHKAAQLCAVQILAQLNQAVGDITKVVRCLSLRVLVASTPDFTDQHLVANGASELLAEMLGEKGVHTRAAFGVASLPLGAAVEIEAQFALAD